MKAVRVNKREQLKTLKSSFCSACLCSDRKLNVLAEFGDVFKQICKNIVRNSEILLCWECRALLRNVKKFQEKVETSQKNLKEYLKNIDEKDQLKNLSCLTITLPDVFDTNKPINYDTNDDVKPDIDELKEETVPVENDCSDVDLKPEEINLEVPEYLEVEDDIENVNNLKDLEEVIDVILNEKLKENQAEHKSTSFGNKTFEFKTGSIEDVKIDSKNTNRKQRRIRKKTEKKPSKRIVLNKKRQELYKITYKAKRFDVRINSYKRIAILPQEIQYWLERERNSAYFKNLIHKCEKCAVTVVERLIKRHEQQHKKRTKFICDVCDSALQSKSSLRKHIKCHYYIRSCKFCDYKCIGKLHMYSHLRTTHQSDPMHREVECLACDSTFITTWEFYEHYREKHYEFHSRLICDYCNRKFRYKRTIEKHITRKHMPQICKECGLQYSKYTNLQSHIALKHHIERTEAAYCVTCNRQFDNILQFRNHVSTSIVHKKERNYEPKQETFRCPECPKVYAKEITMKNHYNKCHTSHKVFYCAECDKTFLNNSKLRHHMKYKHEGLVREKKHICTVCGRGFIEKPVLVKHMRTHTGERPYECTQCDAKFAQRTPMVNHLKNVHMKKEGKSVRVSSAMLSSHSVHPC